MEAATPDGTSAMKYSQTRGKQMSMVSDFRSLKASFQDTVST